MLQVPALAELPFLRHGFSTRACGNLATRYGPPAEVAAARRRFASLVGIHPANVAHFALTHSSRVGLVSEADTVAIDDTPYRISIRGLLADASSQDLHFTTVQGISNQQGIDSLVTATPNVGLFMIVGDSAPVMLVAPAGRGVAMVHVGLVGTVNHVIDHTVESLCRVAECDPSELIAAIGPTVGPCCYALGQSVTWGQVVSSAFYAAYGPTGPGIVVRKNRYFFDLPAAIKALLARNGLTPTNIHALNICTACADSPFFSHSAGVAGRFGALLALV